MKASLELALLLALLDKAEVRQTKTNLTLLERFRNAGWVTLSTKSMIWRVIDSAVSNIEKRLQSLWPLYKEDRALLTALGLDPYRSRNIEALPGLRHKPQTSRPTNRRNWNAIAGNGPKNRSLVAPDGPLTTDWALRIRASSATILNCGARAIDLQYETETLSEFVLVERAWLKLSGVTGEMPKTIVTLENKGVHVDLDLPPNCIFLHVPGSETGPAANVIRLFPEAHWFHFGDLDPEGLQIAEQLATQSGRPLSIFMPPFIEEYADRAQKKRVDWPEKAYDHPFIADLKTRNRGLFQEVLMGDARLALALLSACAPFLLGIRKGDAIDLTIDRSANGV